MKTQTLGLHKPIADIMCEMCGGKVKRLRQRDAGMARLSFLDEGVVGVDAYECARCEVILYADELTFGRFVPPHIKSVARPIPVPASSRHRPPLPTRAMSGGAREVLSRA
ncbi:MAG: hypothetical protein OK456_05955 [Thaumarchaeota archaeon]|nr:hypothetical protein [Nitrososphaerota archaeon]